jgi:hypothetical protein
MTDRRGAEPPRRPPARGRRAPDGRADVPARSQPASPREVARFLIALKPIVAQAIAIRQSWIKELGRLFEEARQGNTAHVTGQAGRLGRDHVTAFREVRWAAEVQQPPPGCRQIYQALMAWLDGLVSACEALIEVGSSGDLGGMQFVQQHVAEARHAARRFNGEYTRLVTELRLAVRTHRRE